VCRYGRRGSKTSELHPRGYTEEAEKQGSMGIEKERAIPAQEFSVHQEARGFHS